MAARSFSLVELVETVDWILGLYAKGPPPNVETRPVIERRVVKLVACADVRHLHIQQVQ